tara:strand:- start:626 stop:892 length:267 start_codon:yes stop_codon:yes gene_type:complete
MLENDIEKALCKRVKELGGKCEKFVSVNNRAVPDRLVTLPRGNISFVECKAPGKKPTKLQEKDHRERRALGVKVFVIDNLEAANAFSG